ncbi:MAG: sugar phosphate nucleotidyltransferase [Candidatus Aminicenantales bacterium]
MEALIIAAGRGRRLKDYFSPKPLISIFGLSLIERIILSAKAAGIKKFKIVLGYKSNLVRKKIGSGDKYGVQVEYILNPDWEKGNGLSVYRAKNYFNHNFVLLMSDHLFDESILKKLREVKPQDNQCFLCVDRELNGSHYKLDDVTKVLTQKGKILKIGKYLKSYNALDTGIFLCSPLIFDALQESISRGEYSLSAGIQVLADWNKMKVCDISGQFWIDVDDRESLVKAKRLMIEQLVKKTDGPVSRYLNRKFSVWISTKLCDFNINPNHLSVVSFFLALVSGALFFLGGYPVIAVAGFMAQLSSVLDGCDGEIARLKYMQSRFGMHLDRFLDRYADGLIILGMTFACVKSMAFNWIWLLGFLALIGSFMNSYTALSYDRLIASNLVEGKKIVRIGRDVRLFIVFLGSVLNQILPALAILALITNAESIRRIFVLRYEFQSS